MKFFNSRMGLIELSQKRGRRLWLWSFEVNEVFVNQPWEVITDERRGCI